MALIERSCERLLTRMLSASPAVLLVGARQTGKSSLAGKIAASRASVYFDLEKEHDLRSLANPGVELRRHGDKLVVIDEVQHIPDLFKEIRTIIDEMRAQGRASGKFLLLGSVTERLQRQSESLTGRIMEMQLHPFNLLEMLAAGGLPAVSPIRPHLSTLDGRGRDLVASLLWKRGGYPESLLADDDGQSLLWRQAYLLNALKKDARAAGSRIPEDRFMKLLRLIADKQGSITPKQEFARQLGLRKNDGIDSMLATLEQMMLVRRLPAYTGDIKQEVRKAGKYYICDSGLHQLLVNQDLAELQDEASARLRGGGWEGFVIQNIMAVLPRGWRGCYLKFGKGREINLILEKPGGGIWAIEIKSGRDPTPESLHKVASDLRPERSFLVHGGDFRHRDSGSISIVSLEGIMNELRAHDPDLHQQQQPPEIGQASPQYQAAITAVGVGDRLVNIRRGEFIDEFIRRSCHYCDQATGPGDRNARNLWIHSRDELLEWLKLESRIDPQGDKAHQWRQLLYKALEAIADHAHRPPSRSQYDFYGRFARLCCYDLLVHVVAVLIANGCHEAIHRLTDRRYRVGGSMLAFICFWSGKPSDLEGFDRLSEDDRKQTVAEFVVSGSGAGTDALLQADLLLFIASMVLSERLIARNRDADKAASGYFCWDPWLFESADAMPPLAFFLQAENREGMEALLSCLGLPTTAASTRELRKAVGKYLEARSRYLTKSKESFLACLNAGNWHEEFPR